ncbi:hypothetical protein BX285_4448 [Streptomyces sp. 1114.5]|uniref:hypothetical protein n=1 Tax=Streptomyces sp. 1114.5 TaxID=1938830 RepID=UPI000F1B1396|nr:hypothetical protein [Streptomyces sp. 1114.5]RKT19972.1 hypothetical protein BX285_4448 [Streptomyces sp. 1114.5]
MFLDVAQGLGPAAGGGEGAGAVGDHDPPQPRPHLGALLVRLRQRGGDVLTQRGHLHRVETGPDGARSVQRGRHSRPWTLHHPVLALDFVEDLLLDIRQRDTEASR